MGWTKQTFVDQQTVITANFLNGLQDQIIADESDSSAMSDAIGDLSELETEEKGSLVDAINEAKDRGGKDILVGGETGQILTKDSDDSLDFSWKTPQWYQLTEEEKAEIKSESEKDIRDLMLTAMMVVKDTTSTEVTLTPEAECRYIYGTLDSLTISSLPETGIIDISFTSGTTPTVLALPETAIVPAWFDPTDLSANVHYSISIEDYKVVTSEWPITT